MKELLRSVLSLILFSIVSATVSISSHGCSNGQTSFLERRDEYVIYCFVNNTGAPANRLTWAPPGIPGFEITEDSDDMTDGGFTARRTSFTANTINSSLTFLANMSLDEEVIRCTDNFAVSNLDSCTLLIYTLPSNVPGLTVTKVTYQSVSLSWSPPTDTGGYSTVNYIITVTPLNGDNSWNFTTDDNITSYTVTGLMVGLIYNFNARASNSIGVGDNSNSVTAIVGEVPDIVSEVDTCLIISSSNELLIIWTSPIINTTTTPPITGFNVTTDNMVIMCDAPANCSIPVTDNTVYNISVTARNIVGDSEPVTISREINFDHLSVTHEAGINNITINCATTFDCSSTSTCFCQVLVNGRNESREISNNTASITIPDLMANTQYSYTVSLVDGSGQPFDNACIMRMSQFTTLMEPGSTTSSVSSSSPTSTIAMSTSTTIVPSSDSMTSTATPTGTTESPSTTTGGNIGVIAGGAAGGGIFLIVVIIIVVLVVFLYKKKSKTNVDFGGARKSVDSDGPIALVEKGHPAPETGQALYQEPDTIKREAAPTGDLYAQPDKPRRNAPSKPEESSKELPTYQDPNTIQRTQAPAMDYLYAEVDKKKEQQMYAQVDKERKGGDGTVYADLALSNTGGQAGYPGASSAVIYSDVNPK